MSIPTNITGEHVLLAIKRIQKEGVENKRKERKWAVIHEEIIYPCKLVISLANVYAHGEELDPNPKVFTTSMAQKYLKKLDFEVISLSKFI